MSQKDVEMAILKEKLQVEDDIMRWYGEMEIERRKKNEEMEAVEGECKKLREENSQM